MGFEQRDEGGEVRVEPVFKSIPGQEIWRGGNSSFFKLRFE